MATIGMGLLGIQASFLCGTVDVDGRGHHLGQHKKFHFTAPELWALQALAVPVCRQQRKPVSKHFLSQIDAAQRWHDRR